MPYGTVELSVAVPSRWRALRVADRAQAIVSARDAGLGKSEAYPSLYRLRGTSS
jgi:hypothetical protein